MRFRALDAEEPKYLGVSGLETRLFNLRSLVSAGDHLCITEGEIDAISVEEAGIPAVGVPGVDNWKPHHRRLFEGYSKVLVVGDNDPAGRRFMERVVAEIPCAQPVTLGAAKDLNELLQEEGPDGIRAALGLD